MGNKKLLETLRASRSLIARQFCLHFCSLWQTGMFAPHFDFQIYPRKIKNPKPKGFGFLELLARFELATSSLPRRLRGCAPQQPPAMHWYSKSFWLSIRAGYLQGTEIDRILFHKGIITHHLFRIQAPDLILYTSKSIPPQEARTTYHRSIIK